MAEEGLLRVADEGQEEEPPSAAPTSPGVETGTADEAAEVRTAERHDEAPTEVELPDIDFASLTIEDAPTPAPRDEDGGRRRRTRQPGLGPVGPVDHDAVQRLQRRIGRRGERAVYEAECRRLIALGRDPAAVFWRSQDQEFAPFDIESQDGDGQQIYIEVKSATSDDPRDPFEISDAELLFAMQKRGSYYIYRVTLAHTATPAIERYRDPIGRLHDNTARLHLSGARLTFLPDEEPSDLDEESPSEGS